MEINLHVGLVASSWFTTYNAHFSRV